MESLYRQHLRKNNKEAPKRNQILLGLLLLWNLSSNISCAQSNTSLTYPSLRTNDKATECFINQCLYYLGTTEQPKGSNWGKDIKPMLASVGINFPAPWCAAYVGIVLRNTSTPYPYSGFVPNWSRGVWKEKVVFDKRKAARSVLPSEVRRGDIATIYFPNLNRDAHIFVILGVTPKGSLITIEGNTNEDGGREGYMVAVRVRELWQISKLIRFELNKK